MKRLNVLDLPATGILGAAIVLYVTPFVAALSEAQRTCLVKYLLSGDAAGWAQALGAVGAIAGAFWLARRQSAEDRRRREDDRAVSAHVMATVLAHEMLALAREIGRRHTSVLELLDSERALHMYSFENAEPKSRRGGNDLLEVLTPQFRNALEPLAVPQVLSGWKDHHLLGRSGAEHAAATIANLLRWNRMAETLKGDLDTMLAERAFAEFSVLKDALEQLKESVGTLHMDAVLIGQVQRW